LVEPKTIKIRVGEEYSACLWDYDVPCQVLVNEIIQDGYDSSKITVLFTVLNDLRFFGRYGQQETAATLARFINKARFYRPPVSLTAVEISLDDEKK
jgi:hypothetical protein